MNPVLAMLLGIILLLFLIIRTRIQAFPALIIAATLVALGSGLGAAKTVTTVTQGFGNTLTYIGIVIGFGCILGKFLEKSGAARRMALFFLHLAGIKRADIVLGLTGFLVSIPVFADSGFIILISLAKEMSRLTRRSMLSIGCTMGFGLYLTTNLVPPTPGPLAAAAAFGVDLGLFILGGILLAIPIFIVSIFFFRWISSFYEPIIPERSDEELGQLSPEQRLVLERISEKLKHGEDLQRSDFSELLKDDSLPSAFVSFSAVLLPIVLILGNTIVTAMKIEGPIREFFTLMGSPMVAIFMAVLLCVFIICKNMTKEEALKAMEDSLADAGLIVFVTGAGGAFGNVIKVTGAGNLLAEYIAGTPLPAIVVPFAVAVFLRFPQGSGATSIITGSAIVAPMVGALGIDPLMAGLAICTGAMCPSYLNDSFFWVLTRFSGFEVKLSLKTWSVGTVVMPISGFIFLLIANAIFF